MDPVPQDELSALRQRRIAERPRRLTAVSVPIEQVLADVGVARDKDGAIGITLPGWDLDSEQRLVPALSLSASLCLIERLLSAVRSAQCVHCSALVGPEEVIEPTVMCPECGA